MQHLRDRKKRVDMSLVKSKSLTPIFSRLSPQNSKQIYQNYKSNLRFIEILELAIFDIQTQI